MSLAENKKNLIESQKQFKDAHDAFLHMGQILTSKGVETNLVVSERFRILKAKIDRANKLGAKNKVLAMSSALPAEGKSFCAVNLARALSRGSENKLVLLDMDLRRPTIHSFFGLTREVGVSELITEKLSYDKIVKPVTPRLDVVTAGEAVSDPMQILDHPNFPRLIEFLKTKYDYVIIDSPPVLLCSEPITISLRSDAVVLVVKSWKTARNHARDAVETIGREKVIGVILNHSEDPSSLYSEYGYYGAIE